MSGRGPPMSSWRGCSHGGMFAGAVLSAGISLHVVSASEFSQADTFLLFSGSDLWRDGRFGHAGALWAPNGLDRDGVIFRANLSAGLYRYTATSPMPHTVIGQETTARFAPGWKFKIGRTSIAAFAGLDVQQHTLWPDDPGSRRRGSEIGAFVAADLWSEPTPDTMIAANASLSTIDVSTYALRLAGGWRMLGAFYAGPEVQVYSGGDYRQNRIGLHVTGLRYGSSELQAAFGWSSDSDDRRGLYIRFGINRRM